MADQDVEQLFREFLSQGPEADFDAFCRAHPGSAQRLRALQLARERRKPEELRELGELEATLPGEDSDARGTHAPVSSSSSELLRRIVAHGAKGTRYSLRGEIARGGMGAILRVWDEDLGRELAMKVVLGKDGGSADALTPGVDGRRVARFLEEAQVTGQLDHPCVVPVHELGLDDKGQVYFTMRLVRGRDLDRIFALVARGEEGWTETRALGVLLRVCEALSYAHSKGVIHRDLKPANVMVGSFGEVYVMDWGLARVRGRPDAHDLRLRAGAEADQAASVRTSRGSQRASPSDSAVMTMEGEVLGTPAYMPPEQARGRVDEISARSDVYSIGAMLYHLLAGRMPYATTGEVRSGYEVLRAVLDGPPTPLGELRHDVPAELEAICEKAMARSADDRYPDTLELAEDLRAFLEGRVVRAYATGALVELRKWMLRNKPLAAAAGLAVVFLATGMATSLWQKSVADRNAVRAAEQAEEATRKGDLAVASQALAETREREAAAAARRAEAVGTFLTGMLASVNPINSMRRDMPVSEVVDEAGRKLDAGEFANDPSTEFALRRVLGDAYQSIYRFEESEQQYRASKALLPRLSDLTQATGLALDIDLADTVVARGNYAECDQLVQAALRAYDEARLVDEPLRARMLQVGAMARYNLGSTQDAIAMTREALALRVAQEGEEAESCAMLRGRLAFYLVREGSSDEALELVDRSLDTLLAGSTKARVEASSALRVRADIRAKRRKLDAGLADLQQALEIRSGLFGDESTHVADVYQDIAHCEMQSGRLDPAEEHARLALELRRRLVGDHRDTATSLATLGSILEQGGELGEAREVLEEGLAMRRKVLGEGNAGIGDSLRRLATVALKEGNLAEAERDLRESLAVWEASLGPQHQDLADVRLDLGRVLRLGGRAGEARPLLESALEARVRAFGETHAAANEVRDELFNALLDSADYSAAETCVRETLALYEKNLRPGNPLLAYTRAQLGAALSKQARHDEAEPLLLEGWKAIGEDPRFWPVNKLFLLDHLVLLYEARGDEAAAESYRERAAKLR